MCMYILILRLPRQSLTTDRCTVFLPDGTEHFTKAVSLSDVIRNSVNTKPMYILIFFKLLRTYRGQRNTTLSRKCCV